MVIYSMRMIQGHSNTLSDPVALGWRKLMPGDVKFLFHMTHAGAWKSIRDHGILPGRMVTGRSGRPEAYFTQSWRDFGGPDQKLPGYPTNGALCVVIDAETALANGHEFWITRSNAVITRYPVERKLIIYILDNKLDDPMSDPWFARGGWNLKKKKGKKADTVSGGSAATRKEQASSSSSAGPARGGDWKSWGTWEDPTPGAAAIAAEPITTKDELIETKTELIDTKSKPDLDAYQDDDDAFAEVYRVWLKENPGIEEMSIKNRRIWQRYLYKRSTVDVPTYDCWYCSEKNPLIETKCGNCFRNLMQEGTPAEQPDIDDMRISHAIRLGKVQAPAWKFFLRGQSSGNRESQRSKDHYQRARKVGFENCVHRFLNDPWYRNTCVENNLTMKDMWRFEEEENPEARKDLFKRMSKREREDAHLGKWVPDVDYGAQDQGGNDSNYRKRKPKAKQQKKEDSGWKMGTWPSAGSTAAPKKEDEKDEWEKSDWWYQ